MSGFSATETTASPFLRIRRNLCAAIWPELEGRLPTTIPAAALNQNIHYKAANFDPNCVRLDKLTCSLPLGGVSTVDLLYPANPINVCAIAWPGHGMHYYTGNQPGVDVNAQYLVMGLLAGGCHVLAPGQPAYGWDASPYTLDGGLQITASHLLADFQAIDNAGVSPLVYFLEPGVQALNYVLAHFDFERICCTGLSGGGMMTDYLSAICTEVERSAPCFGSMVDEFNNPGGRDGEQQRTWPWYTTLTGGLTDLAILGALERNRRQKKFMGRTEPVFPVDPTYNAHTLAEVLARYAIASETTSGRWSYYLDSNPVHGYSTAGIAEIVSFFTEGL